MGLYEFGEVIFGMVIFMNLMLIGFGGLPDSGIFLDKIEPGLQIIGTVNTSGTQLDQNSTISGDPVVVEEATGVTLDNFFFYLGEINESIPGIIGLLGMVIYGYAVAFDYIGLPPIVSWVIVAPLSIFMTVFLAFFFLRIIGSLRGGGSV